MPTISLCMIVCNEEDNIRRCLESARGLADEIIVVDTGSADGTKSICGEYGARIFDFEWCGDFSAARNYGLSKAVGGWLLLLDADEELAMRDPAGLREYLQSSDCDFVSVKMTHFYGDAPPQEKRSHLSGGLRLARNDGVVRFEGRIHESVATDGKRIDNTGESRRFVNILHYGYMEDALLKKQGRNISLLLKENVGQADDPRLKLCLTAEYYRAGRLSEALCEINAAIAVSLGKGRMPPPLAYKLKYDILITSRCFGTAYIGVEKAIELYPDYVDLHFYKGLLQYNRGDYGKALCAFLCCLILGETNMEHLILSGAGSFLAMYFIGLCHEKQGEPELAAEAFSQAETLCPGVAEARDDLESMKIYLKPFSGRRPDNTV